MVQVGIIAISKNEGRYLKEWLAYHLSLGVSSILVYDNESSDDSASILQSCRSKSVSYVSWPSVDRFSPQRSAYMDGIARLVDLAWTFFIDVDEFIVPFGYDSIGEYVLQIPSYVSAVAINWRTFGSSKIASSDYKFVTETFTQCGREDWSHNCHFKTVARPRAVREMKIHHPLLADGLLTDSSFRPFEMVLEGRTQKVNYDGIQLNHYQVKTLDEFRERMKRGNANFPPNHPQHNREAAIRHYDSLNNNESDDYRIGRFLPGMKQLIGSLWHE